MRINELARVVTSGAKLGTRFQSAFTIDALTLAPEGFVSPLAYSVASPVPGQSECQGDVGCPASSKRARLTWDRTEGPRIFAVRLSHAEGEEPFDKAYRSSWRQPYPQP